MRALWLCLLLWPGLAMAETVSVRTGWHPGFTRMVFAMPEGTDWQLGRTEKGYDLVLPPATDADLGGFFDRIPADRVGDISFDDKRISIDMVCDCHARAFLWRPDRLVVDIVDGAPPADSPFELALDAATPAAPTALPDLGLVPRPGPRLTLDDIDPLADLAAENLPADLTEVERNILDGLSRAMEQGLIDLGAVPARTPDRPSMAAGSPVPPDETPDLGMTANPASPHPGLVTRTSVDTGAGLTLEQRNLSAAGQTCWPDEIVDVASWVADGQGFSDATAEHRGRIFGEFDTVDSTAVTRLARVYVHFGFGREALQTLQIDNTMSQERYALRSLALMMDGDREPAGEDLQAQVSCPGLVALWAVMAADGNPLTQVTDPDRLILTFRALPDSLQLLLATRLAEKFVAYGDADGAEAILLPARENSAGLSDVALVDADVARNRGRIEEAAQILTDRALSDPRLPPEKLAELIHLLVDRGDPVDEAVLDLVAAQRFEFRDAPVHADLAAAEVRGLSHRGDHALAFGLLREVGAGLADSRYDVLFNEIVARLVGDADDVTFLELTYADRYLSLDGTILNAMASRLLDLGFPERARGLLQQSATAEVMAERRYLRARAAMALEDTAAARQALAGIDTPRARAILDGEPDPAAGELDRDETLAAWRAEAWSDLTTDDDDLLREVSRLALSRTDPAPDTPTPIATGRELVERSGELRTTVEDLLNRFDVPEG